ncbi:universal stress protein [Azospirillum thermophilum]|uniref:Universal stress protein n=1 Tax=Azospirillum thermophilum TaxID=2202148 RepID=A0A2S2CPU7_9PROT|nr:universal stress protein [Azospirillum thermophilum]AWK86502.1 universal stress protein [Azospirillum thermophilum]
MTYRMLVPLHTHPEGNTETIAVHVAEIARHLSADVHALACAAEFPQASSPLGNYLLGVPAMIEDAREKSRSRGRTLFQALRDRLDPAGIPLHTEWADCFPSLFGDVVAVRGRYHDLILVGAGTGDQASSPAMAEAAIFGSGRPTLLVPEAGPPGTPDHVLIAWDGSRVAARAVADADPFLRRARTVTIATVVDDKALEDAHAAERLAEHLADHGIQARVRQVQGNGRPTAEALLHHMAEKGANLLVMGGFGHSRLRDFVLGGATRGVLDDVRRPVLLSH